MPLAQAELRMHNVGKLTDHEREKLADWLEQQAADLIHDGKDYADVFTTKSQTRTVKES